MIQLEILSQDGSVLSGENKKHLSDTVLFYEGEYVPGNRIRISVGAPGFYVISLEDTLGEEFVYFSSPVFEFNIPFEEARLSYNPRSFSGTRHLLHARPADSEEIRRTRNLARNVYDCHENHSVFPHASANVETRGESVFAARNAIDGVICSWVHGNYPFGSWGINRRADAEWRLDFGRKIEADTLILTTRADFPHDSYWTEALVEFADNAGTVADSMILKLKKTGDGQCFPLSGKTFSSLTLRNLKKADDESPFPALVQAEVIGRNMISGN
jgi:hypothetical protein